MASWEEELCGQRVERFPRFSYQFLFQPNMRISGTALNPFGDRRACTQFHRWDERVGRSYLWILCIWHECGWEGEAWARVREG